MENIFPSCLGFAKLGVKNETQAVYQVNDDFKYHVKLLDENFYLDEYHYGNIVKSIKGKSLKDAFVNHFRNYDPLNCPIQKAWISKVTSIPFVYADYITKDDMNMVYYPQLFDVVISIPFLKDKESIAQEIIEEVNRREIGICRIDQCLHITVYPGNKVHANIKVLGIKITVVNVYPLLKLCSKKGLVIKEKRFRIIVNRPNAIKNSGVRIFQGVSGDDWNMYMICLKEC